METTPAIPQKFEELMKLEKIERHHLDILTTAEKAEFLQLIHAKIPNYHGEELDRYIEQTSALLDQNEVWEFNHRKIEVIIERYVKETGNMPSTSAIATATKLSRHTVRKHLNAVNQSPVVSDQNNGIALMLPRVMGSVLKQALQGDVKAARVYIEAATKQKQAPATIINQNNYIQINKTIISQQLVEQLTPDQLEKIELIITGRDNPGQQPEV